MSIAPTSAGHPDVPGKKISLSSALSSPKGAPQVARSTSIVEMFSPPEMMMSFARSRSSM